MLGYHHIFVYAVLLLAPSTKLISGSDDLPEYGQDSTTDDDVVGTLDNSEYNSGSKTRVKRLDVPPEIRKEVRRLKKDNSKYQNTIRSLENQLKKEKSTYVQQMRKLISQLKLREGQLRKDKAKYQDKIKRLVRQLRKKTTLCRQSKNRALSNTKAELQSSSAPADAQKNSSSPESQPGNDTAKCQENIHRLESQLKNATEICQQNISSLNTEIRKLKDNNGNSEKSNTEPPTTAADDEKNKSLGSQPENDRAKCQENIQQLESQLKNTTETYQQNISMLNTEIHKLEGKNSGLEDVNAQLQTTAEKCQRMYATVQALASETCGCPTNWQLHKKQCYRFMKQKANFANSSRACRKMNAWLVTEDKANREFLVASMYKSESQWVGYKWGEKKVRNWSDRMPVDSDYVSQRWVKGFRPPSRGCVLSVKVKGGKYFWTVKDCSKTQASSVCQRNAECPATVSGALLQKALQAYE